MERVDPVTTGIKNDGSTQPKHFLLGQKARTAIYKMSMPSLVAIYRMVFSNGGWDLKIRVSTCRPKLPRQIVSGATTLGQEWPLHSSVHSYEQIDPRLYNMAKLVKLDRVPDPGI
jgi:hypothetical protein